MTNHPKFTESHLPQSPTQQVEIVLEIAERLARREKALLLYIKTCQARVHISREELEILGDILEIMSLS